MKSTTKYYDTNKVMMKTVQGATIECTDEETKSITINENYVTITTKEEMISIIPMDKIYEIIIFPNNGKLFVATEKVFL